MGHHVREVVPLNRVSLLSRNPTIVSWEETSSARVQVRVPSLAQGTSASGLGRKDSSAGLTLVSI